MIIRSALGAVLLLTLVGCGDAGSTGEPDVSAAPSAAATAPLTPSPTASEAPISPLADGECGADKLASFVNLLPTAAAKADIAAAAGTREARYIEPGQPVTDDLVPMRLNAELGVDGRIKRFYCG